LFQNQILSTVSYPPYLDFPLKTVNPHLI
jgi:hypothetical protein